MMENKERVLAYEKAEVLSDEELTQISGGEAKMSSKITNKASGHYPGDGDWHTDVKFDW